MIEIKLKENGIEMHGHATGSVAVCAAVSAVTQAFIDGLVNVTGDRVEFDISPGNTVAEWQRLSDKGKALYDTWLLAMQGIQGDTLDYIKVI